MPLKDKYFLGNLPGANIQQTYGKTNRLANFNAPEVPSMLWTFDQYLLDGLLDAC